MASEKDDWRLRLMASEKDNLRLRPGLITRCGGVAASENDNLRLRWGLRSDSNIPRSEKESCLLTPGLNECELNECDLRHTKSSTTVGEREPLEGCDPNEVKRGTASPNLQFGKGAHTRKYWVVLGWRRRFSRKKTYGP